VLHHLAAAGASLPRSLEILVTFPFPRDSGQASPGDFNNLQADLDLTPILCAAFAQLSATQVIQLIQQNPLLGNLLGGESCPSSSNNATKATNKAKHKSAKSHAPAASGSGSGSGTNPTSPLPLPVPLPTPSGGLGQLLNGLLGGGQ